MTSLPAFLAVDSLLNEHDDLIGYNVSRDVGAAEMTRLHGLLTVADQTRLDSNSGKSGRVAL